MQESPKSYEQVIPAFEGMTIKVLKISYQTIKIIVIVII